MDFDTANWDNVRHCNVRAMMLTTDENDYTDLEQADMVIDIFPGVEQNNLQDWWIWLLILIIIIIVALIVIYLYWRSKKKKSRKMYAKKKIGGK